MISIRRRIYTYIILGISSSTYISIRISTTLNMNMIVRNRGNVRIHSSISTTINVSIRTNITI